MDLIRQTIIGRVFRDRGRRGPEPLRVAGVRTAMTPEPDDAELAAQALLESLAGDNKPRSKKGNKGKADSGDGGNVSAVSAISAGRKNNPAGQEQVRGAEYYRRLSERIRETREAEARAALRYLAYCEEQLALPKELYVGQVGEMEAELYKRQSVAEREGGELLRRWQHCLAECIVRNMSAATENTNTDYTDDTDSP